MPAPKTNRDEGQLKSFRDDPKRKVEDNDCGVAAVAVVAGCSYAESHKALEEEGRKPRKGTRLTQMFTALRHMGLHRVNVPHSAMLALYPNAYIRKSSAITTHHPERFPKAWADMPPMIFSQRDHVSGFRDGAIHDHAVGKKNPVISLYAFLPYEEEAQAFSRKVTDLCTTYRKRMSEG